MTTKKYIRMDPRVKQLWLEELRKGLLEGGYKQGQDRLKSGDRFCCLAILCDIYSKENGVPWSDFDEMHSEDNYLPKQVIKWAGLANENPRLVITDRVKSHFKEGQLRLSESLEEYLTRNEYYQRGISLGDMNDAEGFDFDAIADGVEEQL